MSPPSVDVAIVGAGAGGAAMAAKLAQAGKRVVMLEAGPPFRLTDLKSSEIWARRLRWAGAPAESTGRNPLNTQLNGGWGSGGQALHHTGLWWRFREDDFDLRTKQGVGLDWPFGYDELRPWYDLVQREVGLSGDAAAERSRPPGEPYPLASLPTFASDDLLARGLRELGHHTHPTPQAILSASYNDRQPCLADSWCVAGCPTGALGNPLVTYLLAARNTNARVVNYATVTRVLMRGSRAEGLEYVDAQGRKQVLRARVVIVAGFTIQTPRLLFNSRTDEHPDGLGNRHDLLGRYHGGHILASAHGFVPGDSQPGIGTNQAGRIGSTDAYRKDAKRGFPGSYYITTAGAFKPNGYLGMANLRPNLFGDDLVRFLRKGTRHLLAVTVNGSPVQLASNRVTVDEERRDANGMPLAHSDHSFAPEDLKMWSTAMRTYARDALEASGAQDIALAPVPISIHQFGGAVMGNDPRQSVTTPYGALHDVPNLFVAGSSLFPMGAAVNPTFTLTALAARSAAHLLKTWGDVA